MRILLPLFIVLLWVSCSQETPKLQQGPWRAILQLQNDTELPFIMEVHNTTTLTIKNAEERILVDEVRIYGDSISIQAPVFEGIFKGVLSEEGKKITGHFSKPSLDRIVPFTMTYGEATRFPLNNTNDKAVNISGNWETVFSPDTDTDRYIAKGIFKQSGKDVTGTFSTTTGDYRYLEGVLEGNQLKLSTFDGAHAFLFKAVVTDSTMNGTFYSGNHWQEPFTARKNEHYELPDATTLTYLKEGYDRFSFAFPDETGKTISLEDEQFKDKVVLVQIMGTWCPNCMDESKYYVQYLREHPDSALEIVALAFEYAPTQEKAFASIKRLKEKLNVPYPIVLAQFGSVDKALAQEKLPMLNHVLSYPTTIFIDKKGEVKRIHTGFNGPATGEKHLAFKEDFEAFVGQLLSE
ncbi:MAG: TlpA disulfide reductase family protein [Bacteroidota bacterium]